MHRIPLKFLQSSVKVGEGEEEEGGLPEVVYLIIVVGIMTMFVIVETYQEHKKFKFGHAASLVMLIGLIMSVFVFIFGIETGGFSETAIFDYAIPIIVFNDGYNMRKQRFFKEMLLINRHGIFVNFFNFFLTLGLLGAFMQFDWIKTSYKYNEEENSW